MVIDVIVDGAILILSLVEYLEILVIDAIAHSLPSTLIFAGTWALPLTVKSAKELKKAMNKPIKVCDAEETLDTIYGTDDLFDELNDIKEEKGTDTDVRPVIIRHLKEELEQYDTDPDMYSDSFEKGALKICKDIAYPKNERNSPTQKLKRIKWKTATPEKITALIKEGADPNIIVDKTEETTPLHDAARYSPHPEVITILLDAGAQLEARDSGESTPFYLALANPNLDVITTLLNAGADIHSERDGSNALHNAAFNPNSDVITTFLKMGLDLEARDTYGETPIFTAAAFNSNADVITILINAGAKTKVRNKEGATLLHCAAWSNSNPEVITILLNAGALVNAKNKEGETPLRNAATFNSNADVITTLVNAGADLEAKDNYGNTPLHKAASSGFQENAATIITTLIKAGADIKAKNNNGETPERCYYRKKQPEDKSNIFTSTLKTSASPE